MQTQFFVSHNDQTLGPWTLQEIMEKLGSLEVIATDFLYDEKTESWVTLMEFQPLTELLNSKRPKAPPKNPIKSKEVATDDSGATSGGTISAEDDEWFVMKDDHRFGPFTYMGLIKALQDKSVFEFEFAWKQGLETWTRIAELPEFQPERVRDMLAKGASTFFKRRFKRFAVDGEVLLHDDRSVWTGTTIQLSEGGMGLIVNNALLVPGQQIVLHFSANQDLPPFKVIGEIVAKKYSKDIKDKRAPVTYGLKFLKIDPQVQKTIQEYGDSHAA